MTTAHAAGNIPEIRLEHRLRIAREFAGFQQAELAEQMGVGRNTVSNAEAGKGNPRKVMINAWALATGVPVGWLISGEVPATDGPGGGESTDLLEEVHTPQNGHALSTRELTPVVPLFRDQPESPCAA